MLHIVLQNKTEQNNPPPELAFLNLLYDQEKPPTLLYFFCVQRWWHISLQLFAIIQCMVGSVSLVNE